MRNKGRFLRAYDIKYHVTFLTALRVAVESSYSLASETNHTATKKAWSDILFFYVRVSSSSPALLAGRIRAMKLLK